MTITGTPDNDHLKGTGGDDSFDLSQGGADTARGLGGSDIFSFANTFDANDRVIGGGGADLLLLHGNYDVTLGAHTMSGIETMLLDGAFDYILQFDDGNIAAHTQLFIGGAGIAAGHHMEIYGYPDTDGSFNIEGSPGDDRLYGGLNGDDIVFGGDGDDRIGASNGHDTLNGGAGSDTIEFFENNSFEAHDRVDGGDTDSINTIFLVGSYSNLTITKPMMVNVERINLHGEVGNDHLKFGHASLPTNFAFVVDASNLLADESAYLDGSGATNYDGYHFIGGPGKDVLIGAQGGDLFTGGLGADRMTGNGGLDVYIYTDVAESTGKHYDTVTDFDAQQAYFQVQEALPPLTHIEAVDAAVKHGTLSTATFDHDLHQVIGAHQLDVHHAVLFTPSKGGLAGELFLIVDINGHAGYQAGEDIVVHLPDARHMSQFDADNFNPIT